MLSPIKVMLAVSNCGIIQPCSLCLLVTEASDRMLASTIVHGWATLHQLGNADAYNPTDGLQQDGFLQGRNLLHLVDIKTIGNAEPSTSNPADTLGMLQVRPHFVDTFLEAREDFSAHI